ncbi:Rhomboid-like protein [Pleurostoma richardsiae]|uniref:Rhomboid-type serine protease n=1 Tax=Pleurostoma richardsiae TaxID=41990 RepID=A0AA38VRA4_9PEZI|nr:Rhomboid-like protein [Pleurostoma richardsiae]
MSAEEYYSRKPLPSPHPSPGPSPFYSGYDQQTPSSYPTPPPYTSQPYLGPGQHSQHRADQPSASPFDTPFDDHVYNTSSNQSGASSQQHLTAQDTGYYGLDRTPSGDNLNSNDGIPLRDRTPKPLADDGLDHVYEVPQRERKPRKGAVRFGELGMFGAYSKKIPWVVYIFSIVQIAVFIGEIVRNATLTGSPIQIKPSFNPMIGPSSYVLINMGSRFVPCMHNVPEIQGSTILINWPCPNTTTNDATSPSQQCTLSDLCGFGGVPEPYYNSTATADEKPEPNQWWRFITPMFMHAGIIHIGFNLLLQLTMGREMEKSIGSIRFFLVYVSAGIFGFVMGGNYAGVAISSTGASGSLFGIIALTLLDLFYSWKDRRSPVKDLMFILLDVIISFVLGLLPGLDNFSHIGGFLMGLALGISVLHSPNALRRRIGDDSPYSSVTAGYAGSGTPPSFLKNPVGFFKGRKPLWWAWWLLRAGTLVAVTVVFIVLLNNFYTYHKTCSWCKYLSCIPVNNWCDNGLTFTNTTTSGSSKRDMVIEGWEHVAKLYAA